MRLIAFFRLTWLRWRRKFLVAEIELLHYERIAASMQRDQLRREIDHAERALVALNFELEQTA